MRPSSHITMLQRFTDLSLIRRNVTLIALYRRVISLCLIACRIGPFWGPQLHNFCPIEGGQHGSVNCRLNDGIKERKQGERGGGGGGGSGEGGGLNIKSCVLIVTAP